MNTQLDYLNDTYLFESKGKVVELNNDEKGKYLVLDRTIFYPQGGGQPSDTGIISSKNCTINVHFVAFVSGQVRHYYDNDCNQLDIDNEVMLSIDKDRRLQNAKIHTAGHLLGSVVEKELEGLIAVKGYHFPDGAYVEFNTSIASSEELKEKLNTILSNELKQSKNITAKLVNYDELVKLCSNIPTYLPKDKPLRVADIEGFEPVPCGGTHLKNLSEISKIEIRKISNKKKKGKISYLCE